MKILFILLSIVLLLTISNAKTFQKNLPQKHLLKAQLKSKVQHKLRKMLTKVHTKTKGPYQDARDAVDDESLLKFGFDESVSRQLWRLSMASYCTDDQIKSFSCTPYKKMDNCIFDKYDHDTQLKGQVRIDPSTIFVAENKEITNSRAWIGWDQSRQILGIVFRGTIPSSLSNWYQNIKLDKVSPIGHNQACSADGFLGIRKVVDGKEKFVLFEGKAKEIEFTDPSLTFEGLQSRCLVHRGFQMTMEDLEKFGGLQKSIKDQLNLQMSKRKNKDQPIKVVITGHSLGAAMATLYAQVMLKNCLEWTQEGNPTKPLCQLADKQYVFESPRVGNAEFVEMYNALFKKYAVTLFRIEKGEDIVVRVPLMAMNFRHAGHQIYYNNFDAKLTNDHNNQIPNHMKAKYCGLTPYDQYNLNEFKIAKNINMRKMGEYDEHCNHINLGKVERLIPPFTGISDHSNLYGVTNELCQPTQTWLEWFTGTPAADGEQTDQEEEDFDYVDMYDIYQN